MKVLFTYDYGKERMDSVKKLGYDVSIMDERYIEYTEGMEDTDVLVCYDPFKTLDISRLENLKWIQLSSVGIDQAPLKDIQDRKILLTNNRGGYGIPIGEWIVLKTLELLKNSFDFYKKQMGKKWKMDTSLLELYGKTIGFIGTGNIATEAAKRFQGFGVNLLGINSSGSKMEYFNSCYPAEKLDEVLSQCDIVVVTIPYTSQTHRLINEKRFKAMKNGVYFINISRGNIVDEGALITSLENGKIKAAALDVFEEEPLSKENKLWELENVILTPHNSWISEMRNERRFEAIYKNLEKYIRGMELNNLIDLEKGY